MGVDSLNSRIFFLHIEYAKTHSHNSSFSRYGHFLIFTLEIWSSKNRKWPYPGKRQKVKETNAKKNQPFLKRESEKIETKNLKFFPKCLVFPTDKIYQNRQEKYRTIRYDHIFFKKSMFAIFYKLKKINNLKISQKTKLWGHLHIWDLLQVIFLQLLPTYLLTYCWPIFWDRAIFYLWKEWDWRCEFQKMAKEVS